MTTPASLRMFAPVQAELVKVVVDRFPEKSFGYLLASDKSAPIEDFVLFEGNLRNSASWRPEFERRGAYFRENPDAGFVATEADALRVQREIWNRQLVEVAVFHTHRRHPVNFSSVDYELHISRFPSLLHVVISLRNLSYPRLGAFAPSPEGVRELSLVLVTPDALRSGQL